ncbi:MAG: CBS domain-containing protein, partial [bacterium]|nr:CBS domain-containing protein [bacterium]
RNLEKYGEKLLNMPLRSVMTLNPIYVNPDMLVSEVAYMFRERNIDNIPVVKNGSVIGIIDERDIIEEGFL